MREPTAPYQFRAAQAVRDTLTQEWLILARPKGKDAIPLQVVSGQVTYDSGWSPYCQANLTCDIPASEAAINALDPRTGCTIEITTGYTYDDGTRDYHTIAALDLRSRTIRRKANDMVLTAAGQEARVQENMTTTRETPPHTGVAEAITYLITRAIRPATPIIHNRIGKAALPASLADAALAPADDYWSLIQTITAAANITARDTGKGEWEIAHRVDILSAAKAALAVGRAGTITNSEASLDRDTWANSVIVWHKWRDADDKERWRIGRARVASGPYSEAEAGLKVLKIERETPVSKDAANNEAATILNRMIGRGRGYSLDAVSMYWLRPDDTITVTLPTGGQARHLIDSVSFRFPTGDMTVTTRRPETIHITKGE